MREQDEDVIHFMTQRRYAIHPISTYTCAPTVGVTNADTGT